MSRAHATATSLGLVASLIIAGPVLRAGDDGSTARPTSSASPVMPPELARRVQAVADAVLDHHVDPPVRQQMILSGIKGLCRAAGVAEPLGLGRRVSAITTVEQLDGLLRDVWPKAAPRPIKAQTLEEALFEGLLADVPGGAELMTAREARVAEQMAGNRYVGLQIALRMDEEHGPVMASIFPGGPAARAGIAADTIIEAIDGTPTKGKPLREVVDRLRGDEGTEVTLLLRGPKDAASRSIRLRREALARTTITGIRENRPGDWQLRLDGSDPIGYLRILEITGSTPHELRKLAERMEGLGLRALVLDLRSLQDDRGESAHPAVLLADSLLE
ncbi:MAG: S41 family peptidase, partial [Isosphaeraceae bacterium]